MSLEPEFWEELRRIADEDGLSLNTLVARIDSARDGNLSSALRLFVLDRVRQRAAEPETPPES